MAPPEPPSPITVAMIGTGAVSSVSVERAIAASLPGLLTLEPAALKARRREKYLAMGRESLG